MAASWDRPLRDHAGPLAAVGAIVLGVVLRGTLACSPGLAVVLGTPVLVVSFALIVVGFGYLGHRFGRPWLGVLVALLFPVALVHPPGCGSNTTRPLEALTDPDGFQRAIPLLSGVAWVLGAGVRRLREHVPRETARPLAKQAGLALVVVVAVLIGLQIALPEGAIPGSSRPALDLGALAVLAGVGLGGFRLRSWWPAGYLVLAGLLPFVQLFWGYRGALVVLSGSLLPAVFYLAGAGLGHIVAET